MDVVSETQDDVSDIKQRHGHRDTNQGTNKTGRLRQLSQFPLYSNFISECWIW